MKICGIICEYNPFHFGHLYQLEEAKRLSGCDAVLCVMSGSFVQRGEAAVLGRYERARHAVQAGADAVIELPAVFSSSPAELFAKGAVKMLSALPEVKWLCFGAESGSKEEFIAAARALNEEPEAVSKEIGRLMQGGRSYARARAEAWKGKIPPLLDSPNDILGVEYTRAVLTLSSGPEILPVRRVGSGYADETMRGKYSSASAIRVSLARGEREGLGEALPPYVAQSLNKNIEDHLEALEKYALLTVSAERLRAVADCREGLENALKRAAEENLPSLAQALTSKRYTTSRIRRILLQNLLGISEALIRESLSAPLYLRLLAAKDGREDVLSALGGADFPLIVRTGDEKKLSGTAKECLGKDEFAARVFRIVRGLSPEKKTPFVPSAEE